MNNNKINLRYTLIYVKCHKHNNITIYSYGDLN